MSRSVRTLTAGPTLIVAVILLLTGDPAHAAPPGAPATSPATQPADVMRTPATAKAFFDRLLATKELWLRNRPAPASGGGGERGRFSFWFTSATYGVRLHAQARDEHRAILIVNSKGLPYAFARDGFAVFIEREKGQSLVVQRGCDARMSFYAEIEKPAIAFEAGVSVEQKPGINLDIDSLVQMIAGTPGITIDWGITGEVVTHKPNGSFIRFWPSLKPDDAFPLARLDLAGKDGSATSLTQIAVGDAAASSMLDVTFEQVRGLGVPIELVEKPTEQVALHRPPQGDYEPLAAKLLALMRLPAPPATSQPAANKDLVNSLQPQQTFIPGEAREFPLTYVSDRMPGLLIDKQAALLDTGSAGVLVARDVYLRSGSELGGARLIPFNDVTGREQLAASVTMHKFSIGDVRFEEFLALVHDFTGFHEKFDSSLACVLGTRLFAGCAMTLDQKKNILRLETERLPAPDGREILPMRWNEDKAPAVPVTIDGQEFLAGLDTGDSTPGLTVGGGIARRLAFVQPPIELDGTFSGAIGRTTGKAARLKGDLLLGRHVIRQPIVQIIGEDEKLTIGNPLLAQFRVTIDQRVPGVRFTRDQAEPLMAPPWREFSRVGKPGDEVLRINGKPAKQFQRAQWRRLQELGYPVEIVVRRDGKEVTLTSELETLVP